MVILDMQFLWLYIDDLMGKGLEWKIILELMIYASANWVPLALPLSVLLASIMTFGSLGEKNELLALKSSGFSLYKIMKPLMLVIFFISLFAFYFTNSLWPIANFKMKVLLRDIQNTKVALVLQPGVFFKSDNFAIRIGEKNKEGNEFKDILIYDHSNLGTQPLGGWSYRKDPRDYKRVIRAKKGRLVNPENKSKLELELIDGYMVQEWNPKSFADSKTPFTKYNFKQSIIGFKLNSFEFERTSENSYKRDKYLLSLNQIYDINDSLDKQMKIENEKIEDFLFKEFSIFNDSLNSQNNLNQNFLHIITNEQNKTELNKDYKSAIRKLNNLYKIIKFVKKKENSISNYKTDLTIEWNRKFTLSYAVFMLFF